VSLLGRDAAAVAGAVTRRCCGRYDRVQLRPQGRRSRGGLKTQVSTFFIKPFASVYYVPADTVLVHSCLTGRKVLILKIFRGQSAMSRTGISSVSDPDPDWIQEGKNELLDVLF
jgi:hypothetical protein